MKNPVAQVRQWADDFNQADRETKWFIFNWALYGVIIVLAAIYCYARLDFVRSYEALPPESQYKDMTGPEPKS